MRRASQLQALPAMPKPAAKALLPRLRGVRSSVSRTSRARGRRAHHRLHARGGRVSAEDQLRPLVGQPGRRSCPARPAEGGAPPHQIRTRATRPSTGSSRTCASWWEGRESGRDERTGAHTDGRVRGVAERRAVRLGGVSGFAFAQRIPPRSSERWVKSCSVSPWSY